jgi:hypothetical protein
MMRLVSSEWLRLRSRRLVKVLTVLALLGIVVAMVIGAAQSRRPSEAELARARREADRLFEECIASGGIGVVEPGTDVESFCRSQADPSTFLAHPSLRAAEAPEILRGTAFIAILIGLVIGASAVGASWQSGTITTILAWEPRRARVALTRSGVVAAGTFALIAALLGFLVATLWLAAGLRGVASIPPGWWSEVAGVVARVSALAAAASIIGGAIAMIGRNTAAALGAVFIYMAVLEGIVRGLRPGLGRLLLGDNIAAVVIGRSTSFGTGVTITPARGALVVAAYALVLVVLATASFRLRDVQ